MIKQDRKEKYGSKQDDDPVFKWLCLFILISPLVWSLPNMPGFVTLVVFVNVLMAFALPAISIGLLIISNKKKFLGRYTNNWMENGVLGVTTVLAIWGSIKLVMGFFS